MKTVNFLSLFGRLATSSHRQRARPARPFVRPSSLSPSPLIRREAAISFLIGRAQSRDIAQRRETTRTFASIYNPAKCRHCITLKRIPKKDVLIKINRHHHTQRDFPESAKYERISKIQENQPDSENRLDSRNPTDTRPRLSTNESSSSTARHSSRTSAWSGSHRQEAPWTYSGSWGTHCTGPEPFLYLL